jgi:hypothetical protein
MNATPKNWPQGGLQLVAAQLPMGQRVASKAGRLQKEAGWAT